jgi:hypothetical protein
MTQIKSKERRAAIAKHARSAPKYRPSPVETKATSLWEKVHSFLIPGITALATSAVAIMTLSQKSEQEQAENVKSMIESAVSTSVEKERTAIYIVTDQAKDKRIPAGFALSILGTVLRNGGNEKLDREVYDNIEKLMEGASPSSRGFNRYDELEIYCLRAALTPAQSHRQKNIHKIEEFADNDALKLQADSRLLELSQLVSDTDPQAAIDMLLSISGRYEFPDMIERVIPLLCAEANRRDYSLKDSNHDIADFLEHATIVTASFAATEKFIAATNDSLGKVIGAVPKTNHSVSQTQKMAQDIANEARVAAREAIRSQIRLCLARALIVKDSNSRNDSLINFSHLASANDLKEDAQRLLDGISKITAGEGHPANLKGILDQASENLVAKQ